MSEPIGNTFEFGMSKVKDWAQFSGDYNPIHFEIEPARKLGVDNLIVHGMLVLLPVKQSLTDSFDSSGENHLWTQYRASLKSPIPHDLTITLNTRRKTQGLQYSLKSMDANVEFFRGKINQTKKPQLGNDKPIIDSAIAMAESGNKFYQFFQEYHASWIVLDAIVFSDFIKTQMEPLRQFISPQVDEVFTPIGEEEIIVHVNHTVYFDTEFFFNLTFSDLLETKVNYKILAPDLISSKDKVICNIAVVVEVDDLERMIVEMGLVIK